MLNKHIDFESLV